MKRKKLNLVFLSLLILFLSNCDLFIPKADLENTLIICSGRDNIFTFVDLENFEVIRKDTLDLQDSLFIYEACLSTNAEYLICYGHNGEPNYTGYVVTYDFNEKEIINIISTDIDHGGRAVLCPANIQEEPNLAYLFLSYSGIYEIDYDSESIVKRDDELVESADIFLSEESEWIAVNKFYDVPFTDRGHHVLDFYSINSHLQNEEFTLNEINTDTIDIKDVTFSALNEKAYISFLKTEPNVDTNAYFGSYDLLTRELDTSMLAIPGPYYDNNDYFKNCIAINNTREEIYVTGYSGIVYVVGLDSTKYYLKNQLTLYVEEGRNITKITISNDDRYAIVSHWGHSRVYIIDLENLTIAHTLRISRPYALLIVD